MAWRIDWTGINLAAGLAVTCALVGVIAGIDPRIAIAASLGIAFVLLVIADLTVGLVAFTVLTFIALVPDVGGPAVSFLKVSGLLLAFSWLALVTTRNDAQSDFLSEHGGFTALVLVFLAWIGLTAVWAEEPNATLETVSRYGLNAALFLIVFTAVRRREHALWLAAALLIGASLAAVYALVVPPEDPAELSRLGTSIANPNELASAVLVGFAVGVALSAGAVRRGVARAGAAFLACLCLLALFLTLSRGGLAALAVAVVAGIVFGGRWRWGVAALGVAIALSAVFYFQAVASPEARERVTSTASEEGEGRTDLWQIGWRMVEDKPTTGVGAGNFEHASVHYLLEPGTIRRDEFIVDEPKSAHNMYLQVFSETGVVGLVLFSSILLLSLSCVVRAAWAFARRGDTQLELLSRGVFVALLALLAADFFGSRQYAKELWLLLGLAPSLLAIARREPEELPRRGHE